MKKISLFILCFALVVSVGLFFGCSKKEEPVKKIEKKPIKLPEKKVPVVKPETKKKTKQKLTSFLNRAQDLEPYTTDAAKCTEMCNVWCPLAGKCQMAAMKEKDICDKRCLTPCKEGKFPKIFAECLLTAKECKDSKACFQKLRKELQAQHAAKKEADKKEAEKKADQGKDKAEKEKPTTGDAAEKAEKTK